MREVAIVVLPQTAGFALYGMVDVLSAAGNLWETLVRAEGARRLFDVRIVSALDDAFECGNGVPVRPAATIADAPDARIVIVLELWLDPDQDVHGRYPELMD